MDSEVFGCDVMIEEVMECGRAEEFCTLGSELFSSLEDFDE